MKTKVFNYDKLLSELVPNFETLLNKQLSEVNMTIEGFKIDVKRHTQAHVLKEIKSEVRQLQSSLEAQFNGNLQKY